MAANTLSLYLLGLFVVAAVTWAAPTPADKPQDVSQLVDFVIAEESFCHLQQHTTF